LTTKTQQGGVPGLNRNDAYLIKIPLPPLPEQERIVAILDKFDALVNDISIGLPAELEARRKQYEYYRGKLLTFREKVR
jgi:type I restriction enzyme S subunit